MDDGSPPSDQALAARISDRGAVLANAAVAAEVIAAFADAGIDALLIKGASSAALLDSPGSTRSYGDVDLLVDPDRFDRAAQVLRDGGFRETHAGASRVEVSDHALDFLRGRSAIDLHWRVAGVGMEPREAWAILWRHRLDRVLPGGVTVPCLDDPGVLLVVALHASADPNQNPKAMRDLKLAVANFDVESWAAARDLAAELSALDFLASGLVLAPGGDVLVRDLGLGSAASASSILRSNRPPPLALGLERLAATPGVWRKVRVLAREAFPTPDGMRYWRDTIKDSRVALVRAYLERPGYLLIRLPSAVRAVRRAQRASRGTIGTIDGPGPT